MRQYLFFALISLPLFGLPQGANPTGGQTELRLLSPETLTIIASDQSMIEWSDFSIEVGETVRFIQPNEDAFVLNQVIEAYPSRLMGNLESNGQVLLINPNGILVGKEAQINTGAFFASTLPLDLASFKDQNHLAFDGSSGKVRVEGTIRATRVALIGMQVEQAGQLFGATSLCSGGQATLSLDGEVQALNTQLGRTQVTGSIEATAGSIAIYGEQIRIEDGALLDVSSPLGGGIISIGGKGLAPSEWTLISDEAIVRADALEIGNGGQIVIWSEEGTISHGSLSSKGGMSSGNGGFIEVSGRNQLDFNWNADLNAPNGAAGTLLLDPTNIIISSVGPFSAVAFGVPTTWPPLTNPVVINSANVAGGLSFFLNNNGNVSISTTVAPDPGAAGTITVNGASNVAWASANSLTLIADSDIIVNANIQNSGAGNVTLTSLNGNIFINNAAGTQSVSVGTRAGVTSINANGVTPPAACNNCATLVNTPPFGANTACCTFCTAPLTGTGNICMRASNAGASRIAQIGRAGILGEACTGAINVTCNNLSIQTGTDGCSAIVGHGGTASSTNSGNITVNARGTILMLIPGGSINAAPVIGHATPTTSTNQTGNINVTAGQDLIMKCIGNTVDGCLIGHTDLFNDVGMFLVRGDITVRVGRDIWIDTSQNVNTIRMGIGHSFFPSQNLFGNIDVFAGRDLNMIGSTFAGGNTSAYIGLCSLVTGRDITSNIHVEACNNINLDPRRSTSFGIGAQNTVTGTVNGTITVLSGNNINIMPTLAIGAGVLTTYIGYNPTGAVAVITTTTVIAANDITLGGGGGTRGAGIGGQGDVFVNAGRDIILNAATGRVYIGSDDTVDSHGTVLISGRDMIATSVGVNAASFGRDSALAIGPHPLSMQAAGDIQFTRGYRTTLGSPIFIEADTDLSAGELWGAGVFTCPGLAGASAAVNADGIGAIRRAAGAPILVFQTVSGNITLNSASLARSGGAQNFTLGTDASLITVNGNIQISGSVATDAFQDIFMNSPLTTSGSIYVRANRNLNVNTAVSSTGGNAVSLFAGNTPAPGGTLTLIANVSSTGGNVLVQAGAGRDCFANFNNSSVLQTAGTISSTGAGNVSVNADLDITLMSPASINAVSGNVHTLAGHNTNLTNTTITKTAAGGDLLMISGLDMIMTNSHIVAVPAFVTLVVDNCFPISPLIGPGAFILDATSSINASNLRIFTARQSQNQISGVLNLNGNTFVAGTLFVDTATEHWCQYFSSPFPYPLSNLGNAPLYTIFYKDCLQLVVAQAQIVVVQFLVDLHPYNEFPGWMESFQLKYQKPAQSQSSSSLTDLANESYYLRRRHLNSINQPKTWTMLLQ